MQKPSPELVKQLRRQLDFIRNSASAYDAGHSEEALRIGVAIRVLLHDTKFSNSLLNQMGRKESLKLITTAKEIPEDRLLPGTMLSRFFDDQEHKVVVRGVRDFEYRGQRFKSLSAIARLIAGCPWSGPAFFGLKSTKKEAA